MGEVEDFRIFWRDFVVDEYDYDFESNGSIEERLRRFVWMNENVAESGIQTHVDRTRKALERIESLTAENTALKQELEQMKKERM